VVSKVRDALLRLDPENPEHESILEAAHIKGAVESRDEDFEPVRELLRKTQIDPNS
jgi:phosphonate transport system substrate-binding protein